MEGFIFTTCLKEHLINIVNNNETLEILYWINSKMMNAHLKDYWGFMLLPFKNKSLSEISQLVSAG